MSDITSIRIKELREKNGMSQQELADACGYKNRASINKIENYGRGTPVDKIKPLADALHTSPDYLMGWEDDPDEDVPIINMYKSLDDDKKNLVRSMILTLSRA